MQAHEIDEIVKALQSCSIKPNMCHVLRVDAQCKPLCLILSFLHTWTAEFVSKIKLGLISSTSSFTNAASVRRTALSVTWSHCAISGCTATSKKNKIKLVSSRDRKSPIYSGNLHKKMKSCCLLTKWRESRKRKLRHSVLRQKRNSTVFIL